VYNASNNELVRTNTLVKNCIVQIDATPFSQWYVNQYGVNLNVKKAKDLKIEDRKSKRAQERVEERKKTRVIDPKVTEQFVQQRLLAVINSRPGQSGRADGYILEGKELEFYSKKIDARKK
jgi:small subunit ribosomal protein S8e